MSEGGLSSCPVENRGQTFSVKDCAVMDGAADDVGKLLLGFELVGDEDVGKLPRSADDGAFKNVVGCGDGDFIFCWDITFDSEYKMSDRI